MIVFESELTFITWEEEFKLITHIWKKSPDTQKRYKDEHYPLIEKIKEYKPKLFISDSTDSDFTIDPETQLWLAQLVSKEFKTHTNIIKVAIIPNQDMIAELSSQQNVEEVIEARRSNQDGNDTETQFFIKLEDAKNWITQ